MYLNSIIKTYLKSYSIDYLGFADLIPYQNEIIKSGGDIVSGYPVGISIGIALLNSIVDHLANRKDQNVACEYRVHAYDVINQRLNIVASMLSGYLTKKGYKALPIAVADRSDIETATAPISHKMIGHIAGLGWIGKNCLLITPNNGPRVRFISVLTNAPIKSINNPIEQKCGDCIKCVEICPTHSIKGKNYILGEDRADRFNYKACEKYFNSMKEIQQYSVCGMCLYACPYGKNSK
jgi:epoxyqueuosine reductase